MKICWFLAFTFIFTFSFHGFADPDFDRFGFDLELDKKQIEKVVNYFDFSKLDKDQVLELNSNDLKGYLSSPENFLSLPKDLQEEFFTGISKTSFTQKIIKRLKGELPSLSALTDKKELTEFKVGWRKFEKYWDEKISKDKKLKSIQMNHLPQKTRVELFLKFYDQITLKESREIPLVIKELFKNIEYDIDSEALEFRYRVSYKVLDKEQFLTELDEVTSFLKIKHLMDNPLKMGSEDLSFHMHLSGPGATHEFIALWNNKILLDHIQAGFKDELFSTFGYSPSPEDRTGFTRMVDRNNHVELRNLSTSPREALEMDIEDIRTSIRNQLNSRTILGSSTFEMVGKLYPRALGKILELIPDWLIGMSVKEFKQFLRSKEYSPAVLNQFLIFFEENANDLTPNLDSKLSILVQNGLSIYENPKNYDVSANSSKQAIVKQVDFEAFIEYAKHDEETIVRLINIVNNNITDKSLRRDYTEKFYALAKKNNIKITTESFGKYAKKTCGTPSHILATLIDTSH